jgi:hypothetical protein
MITTDKLIEELYKFPSGAKVQAQNGQLLVHPLPLYQGDMGVVDMPLRTRPRKTNLGGFKGWQDAVFNTDGGRIQRWLRANPVEARNIAFAAIAGLYLDDDDETARPADDSYPRGSGSDYVDHVGAAVPSELFEIIKVMQEAAENACDKCGEPADNGEGYDGLCGNCADVAEREGVEK